MNKRPRGLLRDCENIADGSFAAIHLTISQYQSNKWRNLHVSGRWSSTASPCCLGCGTQRAASGSRASRECTTGEYYITIQYYSTVQVMYYRWVMDSISPSCRMAKVIKSEYNAVVNYIITYCYVILHSWHATRRYIDNVTVYCSE